MLANHERALASARIRNEPAGQIAAGVIEIVRIGTAPRRADELDDDVAAAIENATGAVASLSIDFDEIQTTSQGD
jgi:hypothetical protein